MRVVDHLKAYNDTLPEQSPAEATVAPERMRRGVNELTLSGGVRMPDAGDRARRLGRNRVEYWAAAAPQPVL